MKHIYLVLLIIFCIRPAIGQVKPVDSWTDGKYVNVNGAKLYVVTVGEGDPIIFISGGPGGAHVGLRSFDALAQNHHQLIYFDAFGRGKSDTAKVVSEYTLARDIEDIEGLRKALKLDKVTLLGHSYGGLVAQGYALKYASHLSHLILANTFHSYVMWQENDDNSNHEIKTNYPEVWADLMKIREQGAVSSDANHQDIYGKVPYGFLYAYNPSKFEGSGRKLYPNAMNTKLYYQMVGRDGDFYVGSDIGTFDFRKQLKNLKMPVLIIGGRYDRVAVPSMMVKYKEYCPQAQFVMFEKSGHNPQVEEPEKEFAIINEFLAK
ncbi:alpha/beta fold hydrolase [Mucilaginibacter sp. Bleaf8]|uniref:alpha/beta fold hydrolase n=1 Tax=Mucilaginibacter sp. Bleaf8 TaxID=2834430 RepID=UPI001BCC9525|nr:alpha/beta fold hydrolase [Mucilaginibacter sp. Bleaf8]MBS7565248.1 alpha/beta fold hydrolase [Mucilaginibacter sp. Bleaf8]